jgi:type IV fimbrial biogenesis protein FimT
MELMLVLAIAGVILGLAVPNMRDFLRNNRLAGGANELLAAVHMARTEAIKRQLPLPGGVAVCATADPDSDTTPACSGAWAQGASSAWIVWVDADGDWTPDHNAAEPVLARYSALDDSITLRSDNDGVLRYTLTGFTAPADATTPTRNVVMCDVRGTTVVGNDSLARLVQIGPTGRVRVSRTLADINTALTTIGATCP